MASLINLKLFLLQSILAPSLHYGCDLWGMHITHGEAQKAWVALQSIYHRYLRHICWVLYAMPSAMLLVELGISLDNIDDAFSAGNGAKNFSGSIATCLQSPCLMNRGAVPVLDFGTVVEALPSAFGHHP